MFSFNIKFIRKVKKHILLDYYGEIFKKSKKINYDFLHLKCGENAFFVKDNKIENDDISIYQSFSRGNINNEILKLLLCCNVLQQNKVKKINYIAPFLPYTRHDSTDDKKLSLGCKMFADVINQCGISNIYTYDLHSKCFIEQLFHCKLNKISVKEKEGEITYYNKQKTLIVKSAIPLFINYIKKNYNLDNTVIVFPDIGASKRFSDIVKNKNIDIICCKKKHINENKVEISIIGNVKDKNIIILDDIIDTGKTIICLVKQLLKLGAKNIIVCATHGIFSSNSVNLINSLKIKEILITNSIQNNNLPRKFNVLKLKVYN